MKTIKKSKTLSSLVILFIYISATVLGILLYKALNFDLLLIIGPIVNLLMFLFISIPMAENRQSKKEGFEQYKKETRLLLPIPKLKKYLGEVSDSNT